MNAWRNRLEIAILAICCVYMFCICYGTLRNLFSPDRRIERFVTPVTGCHYLITREGGITPELGPDGLPRCLDREGLNRVNIP